MTIVFSIEQWGERTMPSQLTYEYARVSTATWGNSGASARAIWFTARSSGPAGLPSAWITASSAGSVQYLVLSFCEMEMMRASGCVERNCRALTVRYLLRPILV